LPRGTARAIGHAAEILVALLAISLPALTPRGVSTTAGIAAEVQVARGRSSHKSLDDDLDTDFDAGKSDSKGPRLPGIKSAPGGYDPKRVQRFWRHYHGARPAGKVKPLERRK
jgi:hypothetical protein